MLKKFFKWLVTDDEPINKKKMSWHKKTKVYIKYDGHTELAIVNTDPWGAYTVNLKDRNTLWPHTLEKGGISTYGTFRGKGVWIHHSGPELVFK